MILKSLKFRLQLWYGLLLLLVLAGLGVAAFQLERARTLGRIDEELRRRLGALANAARQQPLRGGLPPQDLPGEIPPPNRPRGPRQFQPPEEGLPFNDAPNFAAQEPPQDFHLPPKVAGMFDDADANGFYYVYYWRDGREVARSANTPKLDRRNLFRRPAPPEITPRPAAGLPGLETLIESNGKFREGRIITPPGEIILVGRNVAAELSELRLAALRLAAVGGGILLVGLAGGWWLASRAIRPIADITDAAQKIAHGNLAERIQTADHESELGQLADTLNATFARLESSFAQQAQFTSDAAHELRTPVSVILTQTQAALKKERTAAEYRETLAACERAASRMRRLTESLLQLARLDAGQESLRREPFDLATVAGNCAALITPLAETRQITVQTELAAAPSCGDADRIAQVVTNLLNNAINYNRDGGEIHLAVRPEDDAAVLTVTDTGVGISREDLPRVFERFYRGDKSRTGAGNAGLGLAICQAIVEAHGGTLAVASEPGQGTTFTLRLPAAA